ncbi:S-adenosyl-L-methionine-dependent methyltransferase [Aspergillus stella-maris]|uniref:S-adenosyl-L-methionine-dependent methyltransferase n=1 Tax=Aspergillus stella-maris TaxID=1810926 RepID=UPI003CCD23CB
MADADHAQPTHLHQPCPGRQSTSATQTPSINALATQISLSASQITNFLNLNNIPHPSFAPDAPPSFPSAPNDILYARQTLLESAQSLIDLLTGPAEHLRWLACRHHDMSSLRWIYHFDIARHIPLDSAISYTELALKANVNEDTLKRMIRHAMTNRLFIEPSPNHVAHSASSALLVKSQALKDWVGYCSEETYPASAKVVEAHEQYGVTSDPSKAGYSVAFNTDKPMFEHMASDPERERRFANTMVEMTSTEGYGIHHLVNGYNWSSIGKSKVVDVGGSTGHACIAISEVAKDASFIVQDLKGVVEGGIRSLPEDVKRDGRITFQEHDFFTPQPEIADIYLLRFICHDHPDEVAVEILKALVPAMRNGARLLINDGVLPEPNTLPRGEERIARIMDLEMMTTFNARERPLADWVKLCADADSRFKLRFVSKPQGSNLSILEFVFDGSRNVSL